MIAESLAGCLDAAKGESQSRNAAEKNSSEWIALGRVEVFSNTELTESTEKCDL
jgi:hypothetical protein